MRTLEITFFGVTFLIQNDKIVFCTDDIGEDLEGSFIMFFASLYFDEN